MTCIAIIPARGGSKGIPRKNLKKVGRYSLLARSIRACKKSSCIDAVYVSTDDEEIAEEALRFGAKVIQRPAEISGDTASSESALFHVLDVVEGQEGRYPDYTFFLQCTSPFIEASDLDKAFEDIVKAGADSLFAASASHAFIWKSDKDGNAYGVNHDKAVRKRRQELEPEYRETGAFYLFDTSGFLNAKHRFFGKTILHEVPQIRAIEIDSIEDLELSRTLAGILDKNDSLPFYPKAIVFDFDGVFTDNKVITDQNGIEYVNCDRSDGMGVASARKAGIKMLILSKERNPVTARRAEKLQIEVLHGVDEKVAVLSSWLKKNNLEWNEIYYVGNDINDIECLEKAGFGVVVADAYSVAKNVADLILTKNGGNGAVRELIDLILSINKK